MSRGIELFFNDDVTVETYSGTDSNGQDVFAAPVTVIGFAQDYRRLIQEMDGGEVVAEIIVFTALENKSLFTPDSRVIINGDKTSETRVISYRQNGSKALPGFPNHLSVALGFRGSRNSVGY